MKANYKNQIMAIDLTIIREALGSMANTAFTEVLRKNIKTSANAEGVRWATHKEFARLHNEFVKDQDFVTQATYSGFNRIIEYYDLRDIVDLHNVQQHYVEGEDQLKVTDYGKAYMLMYLLAFYNVQDDYIKVPKTQRRIARAYIKRYESLMNMYIRRYGNDNILKFSKGIVKNIYSPMKRKITMMDVVKLQRVGG